MSLRGKDFRVELDPEIHEMLRVMAEFYTEGNMAAFGEKLLTKAIVGEFHEFTLMRERMERCGTLRKIAETPGKNEK
jgi:hypothetical protein